jgi:mannose-6-phosphate isomerase-like protein (cupin superfamily)
MARDDIAKLDFRTAAEQLAQAPKPYIVLFERGDMLIELFSPRGRDTQGPHDRDELYVIASGSGTFRRGDKTLDFATGDTLFVPAFLPHRFESWSDDFKTWVIFFGPAGGTISA